MTGEFPAQMASNAENILFDDVIMFRVKYIWDFYLEGYLSEYNGRVTFHQFTASVWIETQLFY